MSDRGIIYMREVTETLRTTCIGVHAGRGVYLCLYAGGITHIGGMESDITFRAEYQQSVMARSRPKNV